MTNPSEVNASEINDPERGPETQGQSETQKGSSITLVRRAAPIAAAPVLDDAQRRAVEHRGGPALVLAGPGTGKTTTIVESVVHRVRHDDLHPEQILVLTFSRRAAAELRERIARRLGTTTREPLARTFHSYAFGLLRREAVERGEPTPRLLSAAEQDVLIRDLLRGDVEEFGADAWPDRLRPALLTRGFAAGLRDLLMRAVERDIDSHAIRRLGLLHQRDDWLAAAAFARQYDGVTALRHPPSLDQAALVRSAADLLRDDPELLARERAARRFVVVDEYQDSDPAQEALLQLLAGGGRDLLVVGDPDQSIYGFRGAEVEGIRRFPERFRRADGHEATVHRLTVSRRMGPELIEATRRVAGRIGGPPGHRRLAPPPPRDDAPPVADAASVHVLAGHSQEAAFVAARLRAAHLLDGVPWGSMAVLVRAASAIPTLRRALTTAGVPVVVRRDDIPLVEQPAVRDLLTVLAVSVDARPLDPDTAVGLLTGPFGGADPVALRRLRRDLSRLEATAGGDRPSGELLVEAIEQPHLLALIDSRAAAAAGRIAAVVGAARKAAAETAATAEDVLWAAWSATGVAGSWAARALSGGTIGAVADRHLDAVVELFDAVGRFVDRLPGAGPAGFLEHVRDQELPSDAGRVTSIPAADAVTVLTAHAAKGLEWDVVAVTGVQEGVWPDLRERSTLLRTELFVDLAAHRDDSAITRASARLAEERRLFYVAVTRARQRLIVTAVSDDDTAPSRFLDELDVGSGAGGERPIEPPGRGMDLASVVAELRRVVCDPSQPMERRRGAAVQLARLAEAGVRQADPGRWYGLAPLTDDAPLGSPDVPVRVSPSKIEEFNRCELRWLLRACGATDSDLGRAHIGSLIHGLAERAVREQWDRDQLFAAFELDFAALDVGEGWSARREYERTRTMVTKLGDWLATQRRRVVGVEVEFDVTIGDARLTGRVDRLDAGPDGGLVVVDYKTGVSKVPEADLPNHAQLGAYQAAVEAGGFEHVVPGERRSAGAGLVQLGTSARGPSEQVQSPLADSADPGWAAELVRDTASGMRRPVFRAEPGQWCGYCPAKMSCPAQTEGEQVTA